MTTAINLTAIALASFGIEVDTIEVFYWFLQLQGATL